MKPLRNGTALLVAIWAITGGAHSRRLVAAVVINGPTATISIDQGAYSIVASGGRVPFATGRLQLSAGKVAKTPLSDKFFGAGEAITVTSPGGDQEKFAVYAALPFVVYQSTTANTTAAPLVLNRQRCFEARLNLGKPVEMLRSLGTGGLCPLEANEGSYAWTAIADPATGSGVVAGWLTHARGSGVLFTPTIDEKPCLEARMEYGSLRLEPGQEVSESLLVGWFADAREGLEGWADAVARCLSVRLPPAPVVYCTWYDNVHRGAGSAASTMELAHFAGRELKPYGLSCVQIDDGWQLGIKTNGPKKNFTGHDPSGPYPQGMGPVAEAIRAAGLTPGLWFLPFGGNYQDPFFARHPEWFVKRLDGAPFDNPWGGTCLDMTHPGACDLVRSEIRQATKEWGYRYLKLDGLYGGAGVEPRYVNSSWQEDSFGNALFHDPSKSNIEVFRGGLEMVREAVGRECFVLGCCAAQNMRTYGGSFGLVDAMRVGPDVSGKWDSWSKRAPAYGARHYHLNGRIWWCDPDPFYVRDTLTLDQARATASWTAISGLMISMSDWLPTLPRERLDIVRRCIPAHGAQSRPVDLFEEDIPRIWLVSHVRRGGPRRDVVGMFNWGETVETMTVSAARLGLPAADQYVAYDFWNDKLLPPFAKTLSVVLSGSSCRALAIRPLAAQPLLLSTSRHVTQGILEVSGEQWDAAEQTLTGASELVGGDPYELRVVARSRVVDWTIAEVALSPVDQAAGATIENREMRDGLARICLRSPASRQVHWSIRFNRTMRGQ